VVLSNPPWERIKLQEKEWFAARSPAIANAPNAAARKRLIEALQQEDPALYQAFQNDQRGAECESHFIRNSAKYPLCGRGDVNTYAVFAELARQVQAPTGRAGIIVPSGIATDDTTKFYFQEIMETQTLASLYDFENRRAIFPGVHRSYKFCLLTLAGSARPATRGAEFVFFALDVDDLRDPERRFTLTADEIGLLNPNTRTCPIFRSRRDAELTKSIYRRVPVLLKEGPLEENPWGVKFSTMFHMSGDSHLFRTRQQLEAEGWRLDGNRYMRNGGVCLPLYEAKMIHQFDHRFGTFEEQTEAQANQSKLPELTSSQHNNAFLFAMPPYWMVSKHVNDGLSSHSTEWLIAFRDVTNATNERSAIFAIIPRYAVGHTAPLILPQGNLGLIAAFVAGVNSFVLDYTARQSVSGMHLTYGYLKQLPIPPPAKFSALCEWAGLGPLTDNASWILPRILELTYTAWDVQPFARVHRSGGIIDAVW
jgi:hypothetical protein